MLDSEIVKGQVRNLQIPNNAVAYVDKPSLHALLIPIPPRPIQDGIANAMQTAYSSRQKKHAEAEKLLRNTYVFMLDQLGIDIATLHRPTSIVKPIAEIAGGRFDFEAVSASLNLNFNELPPTPLKSIVTPITERVLPLEKYPDIDINYISLGNISSNTGELSNFAPIKGAEILSSSTVFREGDILFGRMRPYLNKFWVAEFDGICTGEAMVLRPNPEKVDVTFLHTLLLSHISLSQVVPYQSGTSLHVSRPHTF